ncbi:hypothetical protein [Virgisporangium aliadipatigenens]|uniref:hypothetical protein n=1 Tax=Virgisporangium aliadipatigenens TaxID=741659 RepID=UPI001EF2C2A1|nr:hypothetical protein [Virgisporangium aliadipatigenens]
MTGLTWLTSRHRAPAEILRRLARGEIPLIHEGFRTLQPWRAAAHLRELLMACGLLPTIDKQILLFVRWLHQHLAEVNDPDHAQLLRRLRPGTSCPGSGPAPRPADHPGRAQLRRPADRPGHRILGWLAARGRPLADCTQADIDARAVEHTVSDRINVRAFLQWSAANRHSPRFELPAAQGTGGTPLPEHDRTVLLGQLLIDTRAPLRTRVAAVILLLYAQPVSRITRLTIDDIIRDDDQVLLRLGDPPTPVPEPVAALLLEYLGQRTNMRTATNRDSRWLFPGRRAGQPLQPRTLSPLIHELGVPDHRRPHRRDPTARPRHARPDRRRRARLPPGHRRPPRSQRWHHLVQLRPGDHRT